LMENIFKTNGANMAWLYRLRAGLVCYPDFSILPILAKRTSTLVSVAWAHPTKLVTCLVQGRELEAKVRIASPLGFCLIVQENNERPLHPKCHTLMAPFHHIRVINGSLKYCSWVALWSGSKRPAWKSEKLWWH
jgi:hypothetical protein